MRRVWTAVALIAAAALSGCATGAGPAKKPAGETAKAKPLPRGLDPSAGGDPYASTYRPLPSRPTALVGASVFTGTGKLIEGGTVLISGGKVEAVGAGL